MHVFSKLGVDYSVLQGFSPHTFCVEAATHVVAEPTQMHGGEGYSKSKKIIFQSTVITIN